MANTQIRTILYDFLHLFDTVFTVGEYIQIDDLKYTTDYYASVVFAEGQVEKHITNMEKYTYDIDLIVYINNINDDINTRIQYVLDNVLTICSYQDNNNFRTFCGNYQLINAGKPVKFRTSQGLLIDKRQEMVVVSFSFYKN